MRLEAGLTDLLEARLLPHPPDTLRIGLVVPQRGALGMLGPSVVDAALLGAHEANVTGGVAGSYVDLVLLDGGREPATVAREAGALAASGGIDALVGLCASDVHLAVARAVAGRTPYVYTPPHDGTPGFSSVVCTGPAPAAQLQDAIVRLGRAHRVRRWALVGSDYVWPWAVHRAARRTIVESGAAAVLEEFVPIGGVPDVLDRLVDRLAAERADALLISLVGRDQVLFHRALRHAGLDRRLVRLSGALEENGLLAVDGDETGLLYAAMPSFASLPDEDHRSLLERHAAVLGPTAPVLDSYAKGVYDGVRLITRLATRGALCPDRISREAAQTSGAQPVHLARAVGYDLAVVPGVA